MTDITRESGLIAMSLVLKRSFCHFKDLLGECCTSPGHSDPIHRLEEFQGLFDIFQKLLVVYSLFRVQSLYVIELNTLPFDWMPRSWANACIKLGTCAEMEQFDFDGRPDLMEVTLV